MNRSIPLCKPFIGDEEKRAVCEVLDSGWYAHGPKNKEFEENFAEYIGVQHAISMNSCTSSLQLAIQGLGITGEVIVPSFTWVASANAIVTAGATPVFCDIDFETRCLAPAAVESLIGSRTEAIMPVHFGGQSADMTAIMEIAHRHKLAVIEDSAETIGGEHQSKKTGSFAIGCFSFFPTKNMTTGEGGMLTTDDDSLARKVKSLVGHGIDKTTLDREGVSKSWYRTASDIGYNYRMSNILAAMGVEQLKKLDLMNDKRRKLASSLSERLQQIKGINIPREMEGNKHTYQMYTITLSNGIDRDSFVSKLNGQRIGASVHFCPPVHLMKPYRDNSFRCGDLSMTEKLAGEIITLPLYPGMEEDDLEYMADVISTALS